MKLDIKHQETYSRKDLLLRTLFGGIYIALPHMFIMYFVSIYASILQALSFWAILFTGNYPKSWFEFQVKMMAWGARLNATMYNLVDGYPEIGVNGTSEDVTLEVEYPESLSRGKLIVKAMFGAIYCAFPHMFTLYFRVLATMFLQSLAFWVVLFTGNYPAGWHAFNVGTLRWGMRIGLYLGNMTDVYPPFSGKEME